MESIVGCELNFLPGRYMASNRGVHFLELPDLHWFTTLHLHRRLRRLRLRQQGLPNRQKSPLIRKQLRACRSMSVVYLVSVYLRT